MATPTAKRLKPNSLDLIIVHPIDAAAGHISKNVFVANRAYEFVLAREVHAVASTSGTLIVNKCTGTQAPASGSNMGVGLFSTNSTANTPVTILPSGSATMRLAAGDRVALATGGTVTNYAGGCVVIILRPLEV